MRTNLQVGGLLIDTKSNHSHHSASNDICISCIHPRPEFGKRDARPRLEDNVAHICRFSPHTHRESAEIASSYMPLPTSDTRQVLVVTIENSYISLALTILFLTPRCLCSGQSASLCCSSPVPRPQESLQLQDTSLADEALSFYPTDYASSGVAHRTTLRHRTASR